MDYGECSASIWISFIYIAVLDQGEHSYTFHYHLKLFSVCDDGASERLEEGNARDDGKRGC